MGGILTVRSSHASKQLHLALWDLLSMTPCSMNGNNPTDRLIKEQITAARTASGRVLKISLLAKMAGERRKCSSL